MNKKISMKLDQFCITRGDIFQKMTQATRNLVW